MSFDINDSDLSRPKLPLWPTVKKSYASYFAHFPDVLRATWLWLILVAALIGGGSWLQWSWIVQTIAELKASGSRIIPAMPPGVMLPMLAGYLAMMPASASIPVAWQRRIIIGEVPKFCGSNLATKDLWRFVGINFAVFLAGFLPAFIIAAALIFGMQQLGPSLPRILTFVAMALVFAVQVLAVLIVLRLIVLLPARAIGDVTLTFRETWQRTRGNAWRLFWGILACTVVPAIPMYIAYFAIMSGIGPSAGFSVAVFARTMAGTTVISILSLLMMPIWFGFLSHAYRHFFEEP